MASVTVVAVSRFVLYVGCRIVERKRGSETCSPSHFKYLSGVEVLRRICRGVCSGNLVGRGLLMLHCRAEVSAWMKSGVSSACSVISSGIHVVDQYGR